MLKFKDVFKVHNNSFLKNINIEINNTTAIIGPSNEKCDVLLKLLAELYKPDTGTYEHSFSKKDFFFISKRPNISFNSIDSLVMFYSQYYKIDNEVLSIYENTGFNVFNNLKKLDVQELKLVYLILGIYSNAKIIFVEALFDGVTIDVKKKMLYFIEKFNPNLIVTSSDLSNLDKFIHDFVYINNFVYKHNFLEFSSNFYKASLSYNNINEVELLRFNPCYIKVNKRNVVIILKREIYSKFLEETNPVIVDEIDLSFEDIFLLEDYL